jgi:hypothetical protein
MARKSTTAAGPTRKTTSPASPSRRPATIGQPAGVAQPGGDPRRLMREAAWLRMFGSVDAKNPFTR